MEIEQLCCNRCKEVFGEECARRVLVWPGSREEPAEYELRCPRCGSDRVDVTYRFMCDCCDEVQVKHDGELCPECATCAAEIYADAEGGH